MSSIYGRKPPREGLLGVHACKKLKSYGGKIEVIIRKRNFSTLKLADPPAELRGIKFCPLCGADLNVAKNYKDDGFLIP